jgi:glycosyltransferase involved in cell wall biosynthesis
VSKVLEIPDIALRSGRPVVFLVGPCCDAMSGVSTHLKLLFGSRLGEEFTLVHFQVGSEGRRESVFGRLGRLLISPLLLATAILRRDAALVHLNTALTIRAYWRDLAYLCVAKICGARVVYQVHGGELPQRFFRNSGVLAAFLRKTLSLPDAVVVLAQSEFEAYRMFLPGRRIVHIPHGIDCGAYPQYRRANCPSGEPLKLVYVGRLAQEKGLLEALEGLRLALTQGVRAQLVIAGGGPEASYFQQRAEQLGLAGEVSFVGPVFGQSKVELLSTADAFLLPSYSEGLPYALIEAMAAGVAPIATPVGAIPDVMADGVHGLFVPCRDAGAICSAILTLTDRVRLAQMSAACRSRIAAAYSIERVGDAFCHLYSQLCTVPIRAPQRP